MGPAGPSSSSSHHWHPSDLLEAASSWMAKANVASPTSAGTGLNIRFRGSHLLPFAPVFLFQTIFEFQQSLLFLPFISFAFSAASNLVLSLLFACLCLDMIVQRSRFSLSRVPIGMARTDS